MNKVFNLLKAEAKKIAQQNLPSFYTIFSREQNQAKNFFFDHPLIYRLREDVLPFILDSFGHGIEHAKKVALDASTIVLIEGKHLPSPLLKKAFLLSQIAGLLHDTCRTEEDHALKGAELSQEILEDYPLSQEEKEIIYLAIKNHEAFGPRIEIKDDLAQLVSAALYDGDKFRWGPDNFTTTLWSICSYNQWGIEELKKRMPQALEFMQKIKDTFRTSTGINFGPEIVDCGLLIGKHLYQTLQQIENYA